MHLPWGMPYASLAYHHQVGLAFSAMAAASASVAAAAAATAQYAQAAEAASAAAAEQPTRRARRAVLAPKPVLSLAASLLPTGCCVPGAWWEEGPDEEDMATHSMDVLEAPPPPSDGSSTHASEASPCDQAGSPVSEATVLGVGAAVPSLGSAEHTLGCCKPCAFQHTKGCANGTSCPFCHLCGPDEMKRRRKAKFEMLRAAKRERAEKEDAADVRA